VVMLTGVAAGISMFVSALQVYFRDLAQFLPYLLRMWLYLSPVLWFASDVPHGFKPLIWINPIGALLACWSDILIKGIVPSGFLFALGLFWAVVSLVIGTLFFMSREREFAVRL
jgi:ABC-type polysaccharide/polyol phosphate export permease